jgi:hypothetical protein
MAESVLAIGKMTAMNTPLNIVHGPQSTVTHAKDIVTMTTGAINLEMTAALVLIERKG